MILFWKICKFEGIESSILSVWCDSIHSGGGGLSAVTHSAHRVPVLLPITFIFSIQLSLKINHFLLIYLRCKVTQFFWHIQIFRPLFSSIFAFFSSSPIGISLGSKGRRWGTKRRPTDNMDHHRFYFWVKILRLFSFNSIYSIRKNETCSARRILRREMSGSDSACRTVCHHLSINYSAHRIPRRHVKAPILHAELFAASCQWEILRAEFFISIRKCQFCTQNYWVRDWGREFGGQNGK